MSSIYGIYGASGCGRGILPLARKMLEQKDMNHLYFIDDTLSDIEINNHQVISYKNFIKLPATKKYIAIAIANSTIREKLSREILDDGCIPWSIYAGNIVVMDNVEIGIGTLLSPFVTLTSNIKIGRFFHANLYSYVEHDCVIGDFVTFAPRVCCNGNVHIEDHAYIGSGVIIKQGMPGAPLVIGQRAVVGMGAVVTKSVSPDTVVVGNPAKIHRT